MQNEIDQLKSDVSFVKKSIGFDDELFDDLSDFDKKVRIFLRFIQLIFKFIDHSLNFHCTNRCNVSVRNL